MEVRLSRRLEELASFCKGASFLCDVGSDHAYLPIYLLSNGLINKAKAIDNKIGPYERMVSNIKKAGLEGKIIPSLSNGLDEVPPECDYLVLAGMGGHLVAKILEEGKDKLEGIKALVIDAHKDLPFLRKELADLGFIVIKESLIEEEGLFYDVMKLEKGKADYEEKDLLFGPINRKKRGDAYLSYLSKEKDRCLKTLEMPLSPIREKEIRHYLSLIEEERE